jgi:hypothetical protein
MKVIDGPAPGAEEPKKIQLQHMPYGCVFVDEDGNPCIRGILDGAEDCQVTSLISGKQRLWHRCNDYTILPNAVLYTGRVK